MRCSSCNKFVPFDEALLEVNDVQITEAPTADLPGGAQAEVRLVRPCAECSTELKSYDFETAVPLPAAARAHYGEGHALELEAEEPESTERSEGSGRGLRSFYGYTLLARLSCACGELKDETGEPVDLSFEDEAQASAFEEC